MNVADLHTMYVAELQELRSVEDQLVAALPKMVELVEHPQLRQALERHHAETRSQRDRLDALLQRHGASAAGREDSSMHAILREAERWAKMVSDRDCRDAGIIASAQRVEHYEIAVYGTLATWAELLGLGEDRRVLHGILEEEKRADETLTRLAERGINREAAEGAPADIETSRAGHAFDEARGYLRGGTRVVSHQVEDFPLASMLLAGAAGYILAYLAHGSGLRAAREMLPEDWGRHDGRR